MFTFQRCLFQALPVFLLTLIWLASASNSSAQALYGTLSGRITDTTKASVGDAVVMLTRIDTNAASAVTTAPDGTYRFANVTPGRYRVTVEKPGFSQAVKDNLALAVNEQAVIDIVLDVGEVEQSVEVVSDAPLIQSRSAEVSGLVDERRVRELPLNGENFQRLALLAPGAAGGNANNPSFSGARPVTNSYMLDGSGLNDERGAAGGLALGGGAADFGAASPNLISTEAIREFRVITSNADATFGRSSGAQINVVTRSGGNSFSGSSYYYGRNDALDARDFFNSGPFAERLQCFQLGQLRDADRDPERRELRPGAADPHGFESTADPVRSEGDVLRMPMVWTIARRELIDIAREGRSSPGFRS
jgi:hypothetical protein